VSPLFLIPSAVLVVAQFALPRRFAFAPLFVGACALPNEPVIEVGVSLTVTKLLILAGLLRAARERSFVWSTQNPLDVLFAVWSVWAILSGFAHNPRDRNPITERLSLVYDIGGTYMYARAFLKNQVDFLRFSKCVAVMMIFLASIMAVEKATQRNIPWTIATGSLVEATSRKGSVRAAGPFMHPILAGTIGASSIALLVPLFRRNRNLALVGLVACAIVVFCAASSGPFLTLFAALGALALWRWRRKMRLIKVAAALGIISMAFIMNAPIWYLIARIDIAGGSTGYHRAELITGAINHLDRWWLIGTDYTRDWVPAGGGFTEDEVDMTNYYLRIGVTGGLFLMLTFIAILLKAFKLLGRKMQVLRMANDPAEMLLWGAGSFLFAHCVTFISVSYYDQSVVFVFLIIGAVPGLCAASIGRRTGAGKGAAVSTP